MGGVRVKTSHRVRPSGVRPLRLRGEKGSTHLVDASATRHGGGDGDHRTVGGGDVNQRLRKDSGVRRRLGGARLLLTRRNVELGDTLCELGKAQGRGTLWGSWWMGRWCVSAWCVSHSLAHDASFEWYLDGEAMRVAANTQWWDRYKRALTWYLSDAASAGG